MARDNRRAVQADLTGSRAFKAVTPHDSNELAWVPAAIYVGGTGDLVCIDDDGDTTTFVAVQAGTTLQIQPKIIKNTGTSATNIVALL